MSDSDLTLGQRLVGVSFNPSGNEKVNTVKQLFADIIDILTENGGAELKLQELFTDMAVNQVVIAQMTAVKALTWGGTPVVVEEVEIDDIDPSTPDAPQDAAPTPDPTPEPVPAPEPQPEPTPPAADPVPTQIPVTSPEPETPNEPTPPVPVEPSPPIQHTIIQ